jgi:hypothetical protein
MGKILTWSITGYGIVRDRMEAAGQSGATFIAFSLIIRTRFQYAGYLF